MRTPFVLAVALSVGIGTALIACSDDDNQTETNCTDGIDNDGDGLIDCQDPDCATSCPETNCTDGIDNDGDGQTDCQDSDCAAVCPTPEANCTDGIDNDGEGQTDCQDSDCDNDPACQGTFSCSSLADCLVCCASTDQACITACHDEATAAADTLYTSVSSCATTNCSTQCNCQTACNCAAVCDCSQAGYNAATCDNCIAQCNTCTGECSTCIKTSCQTCGYNPTGTANCQTTDSCRFQCGNSYQPPSPGTGTGTECSTEEYFHCIETCMSSASQAAFDLLNAADTCRSETIVGSCVNECNCREECTQGCPGAGQTACDNCQQACNTCWTTACNTQIQACVN